VQVSVIGAELTLTGGYSIVLLAQNMQGYGNLCRLTTRLQASPDRKVTLARCLSLTDLAPHTDGLIAVSSGCISPLVRACVMAISHKPNPSHRRWPTSLAETDFASNYTSSKTMQTKQALQSLADRLRLLTVATHDIHYLSPADVPRVCTQRLSDG